MTDTIKEIQTYDSDRAYKYYELGYPVYIAHPDDDDERVSGVEILENDGHLFIIK